MEDEELREREEAQPWFQKLKQLFREDDVFWNNEIKANAFVGFCLLMLAGLLILSLLLAAVGVFDVPLVNMKRVLLVNLPILAVACGANAVFRGQKHWIKYVLCFASLCAACSLCAVLGIFVPLIIAVPVLLSVRYYSRKFTLCIVSFTILFMVIAEFVGGHTGMLNLNLVSVPAGTVLTVADRGLRGAVEGTEYSHSLYILNLFRGSFAPDLLIFSLISLIAAELARRAHEMVLDQAEVSARTESIRTELDMAKNIQSAVLPKLYPAFPERPELDIVASMNPAKEVGGDFYDYYLLDDDHLLMVIADVSGKGVPAALFMMIAKMLIKTYAYAVKTPGAIAAEVNRRLCEENEAQMFVTAWIGVLEISTGIVTAVDAGHEYPAVKHGDGDFELIKGKKSFVLGGMDQSKYKEYQFEMKRGDVIFLYTDGVPEAINTHNEMFGAERMVDVLNANKDREPDEIIRAVHGAVDEFAGEADQFDDLTMVSLYFKGTV